jgi:hypothetical protein
VFMSARSVSVAFPPAPPFDRLRVTVRVPVRLAVRVQLYVMLSLLSC